MRKITRTTRMIASGVALLAGCLLLGLVGLAAIVIPAALGILAMELSRACRCVGCGPALFWRTTRTAKDRP